MRTSWKVGAALAVVALVGAGVVAGAALADGSAPPQATAPESTREALGALLDCAREQGLDAAVADAVAGQPSLESVGAAIGALGACEDEARALVAALEEDADELGAVARGLVTDTAACLDGEGVTLSRLAEALVAGADADPSLQQDVESCVPALSLVR